MIVRSEKYPSLVVTDLGIRFRDGEVEVSDSGHLERLRRLSSLGVVVPEEPKRRPGRPKKSD